MAMKENVTISLDPELKKARDELYSSLGLDLSTVVNMMMIQSLRVGKLPFPEPLDLPNDETLAAYSETDEIKVRPEKYLRYKSFKESVNKEIDKYYMVNDIVGIPWMMFPM